MKIDERWEKLVPSEEKPIFQLFDAEHPLRFYIGKEISGQLLFLLVDHDRPPRVRSLRAVSILTFERPGGEWSLLFRLERPELASLFALLCEDLVNATRILPQKISAMRCVSDRLKNWRRLLEDGHQAALSSDEIRGLFGELVVLLQYLSLHSDPVRVVRAWNGPFGSDQDFQFFDAVTEVKTIYPGASGITISSERQLFSQIHQFILHVVEMEESEVAGESLNALVNRIRSLLVTDIDALAAFDERLSATGYLMRDDYNFPVLHVTNEYRYNVVDGFPRIIPTALPAGVSKLRYHISLAHCETFQIN